jgi:hydroxyacylglutathione hydrolase
MFGAGCGRLFEGTAAMMQRSLERLVGLPPETRVHFGHEYTASNLRFAAAVEPDSAAIAERAARVAAQRQRGEPSTPSTVADERATNPFARCAEPSVIAAARAQDPGVDGSDPSAVLAVIRRWKDGFK